MNSSIVAETYADMRPAKRQCGTSRFVAQPDRRASWRWPSPPLVAAGSRECGKRGGHDENEEPFISKERFNTSVEY
jgi:hypothetical protein